MFSPELHLEENYLLKSGTGLGLVAVGSSCLSEGLARGGTEGTDQGVQGGGGAQASCQEEGLGEEGEGKDPYGEESLLACKCKGS